jgi:hypothetical protein
VAARAKAQQLSAPTMLSRQPGGQRHCATAQPALWAGKACHSWHRPPQQPLWPPLRRNRGHKPPDDLRDRSAALRRDGHPAHAISQRRCAMGLDPTAPGGLRLQPGLMKMPSSNRPSLLRQWGPFFCLACALEQPSQGRRWALCSAGRGRRLGLQPLVVGGCGACGRRRARWATRSVVHGKPAGAAQPHRPQIHSLVLLLRAHALVGLRPQPRGVTKPARPASVRPSGRITPATAHRLRCPRWKRSRDARRCAPWPVDR